MGVGADRGCLSHGRYHGFWAVLGFAMNIMRHGLPNDFHSTDREAPPWNPYILMVKNPPDSSGLATLLL